jgi:hypothetical protein
MSQEYTFFRSGALRQAEGGTATTTSAGSSMTLSSPRAWKETPSFFGFNCSRYVPALMQTMSPRTAASQARAIVFQGCASVPGF